MWQYIVYVVIYTSLDSQILNDVAIYCLCGNIYTIRFASKQPWDGSPQFHLDGDKSDPFGQIFFFFFFFLFAVVTMI
jgi:hypothetical protein